MTRVRPYRAEMRARRTPMPTREDLAVLHWRHQDTPLAQQIMDEIEESGELE